MNKEMKTALIAFFLLTVFMGVLWFYVLRPTVTQYIWDATIWTTVRTADTMFRLAPFTTFGLWYLYNKFERGTNYESSDG